MCFWIDKKGVVGVKCPICKEEMYEDFDGTAWVCSNRMCRYVIYK